VETKQSCKVHKVEQTFWTIHLVKSGDRLLKKACEATDNRVKAAGL
jgi:hypothetical protein